MTISFYQALIPVAINKLEKLSAILEKAEKHAEEKKIFKDVLIDARLFPDMYTMGRQVQIACDMAKFGAARLAEIPAPSHPDTEKTFDELQERIKKTIDFLKTIKPEQLEGKENLKISYTTPKGQQRNFVGLSYLQNYILPNIYFHITTAYGILRHNGVELGKKDFIGEY